MASRRIFNWIAWSTEKGARNYLYAATQDTEPGAYISQCQVTPISDFAQSEKGQMLQKKLFEELKSVWTHQAPQVAKLLE